MRIRRVHCYECNVLEKKRKVYGRYFDYVGFVFDSDYERVMGDNGLVFCSC